ARCRDVRLPVSCSPIAGYCAPQPWVRIAVRHLTCSPSGGDYPDPKAACAALDDLNRRLGITPTTRCSCPGLPFGTRSARASGRYHGHRIKLALDFCSLCSFDTEAAHDAAV